MTPTEIANTIHYLRKVFVGPAEVETFMSTLSALEVEYRRAVTQEKKTKTDA
jgi:hypothetical protein